jgi:glycosyltransferase involved in cell wall biosynthesis
MLKVGIDLTSIIYHRGVSVYTANLYVALSRLSQIELYSYASTGRGLPALQSELAALKKRLSASESQKLTQRGRWQRIPPRWGRWCWHYLGCNPVKHLFPAIDVWHSWDFLQPPDKNLPLVSTIHDLAILKNPRLATANLLAHHRESWQRLKRRRAHIIAVSASTRADVIDLLGFPPERVHLVYEALPGGSVLPEKKLTAANFRQVQTKYDLQRPYFLFVGTKEPRKNLPRVVEAWRPLRAQVDLVLVGADGGVDLPTDILQLRQLPVVTDQELGLLYAGAQALVYPSLEEGFGLPILEAFAYGTLVVTSNRGATVETAGEAAILVDPTHVSSIRRGLNTVLSATPDQKRGWQQQMASQLAKFSWAKAARETAKVYQLAAKERCA